MNWFQIKAFVNKLKTKSMNKDFNTKPGFVEKRMAQFYAELKKFNSMNIIKLSNGQSVVIDNSPIIVGEGYCLNTDNNEVVYYNGNYGEPTPTNIKKITHSWPKLAGTIELKTTDTMRHELEFWKGYEPVNGMGKFGRQTRINSLSEQIEDLGPEYDSAGFTEEDRVVNGQYKNDNLKK